jgi:hypothetical protein
MTRRFIPSPYLAENWELQWRISGDYRGPAAPISSDLNRLDPNKDLGADNDPSSSSGDQRHCLSDGRCKRPCAAWLDSPKPDSPACKNKEETGIMKRWLLVLMIMAGAATWSIPALGETPCDRGCSRTRTVCKVRKPCLAALEDCLAYALDIPLAMLSPITCPIISPILDALDPVDEQSPAENR